MGPSWSQRAALLLLALCMGCGQTVVLHVPDLPLNPFDDEPPPPLAEAPEAPADCAFMTILIDYSKQGGQEIGARVARAMAKEFERHGTRVTRSSQRAYWSLMILAGDNARRDGYVFSALLSARSLNEGIDPGVTMFAREDAEDAAGGRDGRDAPGGGAQPPASADARDGADPDRRLDPELRRRLRKLPTLYNGLSYGPYEQLESQARAYVRQAYAAVFPAARQLCDFEAADRRREQALERQLPGPPEPL